MLLYILILLTILVLSMMILVYFQHTAIVKNKSWLNMLQNDMLALQKTCSMIGAGESCTPGPSFLNNLFCGQADNDLPDLINLNDDADADANAEAECSYEHDYSSYETDDEPIVEIDDVVANDPIETVVENSAPEETREVEVSPKKSNKKLPDEPAKNFEDGYETISTNDQQKYTVFTAKNGVKRWKLVK